MRLRNEVVVITIPQYRKPAQDKTHAERHGSRQTKTAPMSPWARPMVGYFAKSALTSFKAWIAFVDDVDPAATAHNTAAFLAQLGRLQRVSDFHNPIPGVKIKPPLAVPGGVQARGTYGPAPTLSTAKPGKSDQDFCHTVGLRACPSSVG